MARARFGKAAVTLLLRLNEAFRMARALRWTISQ